MITDDILYDLLSDLLPADQTRSNLAQLDRVAILLSKKLDALGFQTHLTLCRFAR